MYEVYFDYGRLVVLADTHDDAKIKAKLQAWDACGRWLEVVSVVQIGG